MTSISNLSTLGGVPTPTSDGTVAAPDSLGRDQFLQLLTTQLQHQDPLSPLEHHEFVAQLAQFSSLEQGIRTNQSLDQLSALQMSMVNSDVVGMVGKTLKAQGDAITITNETVQPVSFNLEAAAKTANVKITDANGQTVRVLELNKLQGGTHNIDWNGQDAEGQKLPPGTYRIEVEAIDEQGNNVVAETMLEGKVDEVIFESGLPTLVVGDAHITPSQIISVSE